MTSPKVITRFAPSPTGFLHIGGARTALFNYLFSKHHDGKFLLRVEDTDKKRSTQEAIDAILYGLDFLKLKHDDAIVFQSHNIKRHQDIAHELIKRGMAYYCYASPEELEEMRAKAMAEGKKSFYDRRWRDSIETPPSGILPTVRIKVPLSGQTTITDLIQGEVSVNHEELDDFILLRNDGTPTYMLSVVVDDYDMAITHVIRGDDHLSNTFRQIQIYNAMGWNIPTFAHIPLIHGDDGAKMSKRHGALGVDFYEDEGFLPEAICNYLLRLGWSHGNDEIISREQAIDWFTLDHVGKSPSRFDFQKLRHINHTYMTQKSNEKLLENLIHWCNKQNYDLTPDIKECLQKGMPGLIKRAQTLKDLFDYALFYRKSPSTSELKDIPDMLTKCYNHLDNFIKIFENIILWDEHTIKESVQHYCQKSELPLKEIMPLLRFALTAKKETPGMFEVIYALGKKETLKRLNMLKSIST